MEPGCAGSMDFHFGMLWLFVAEEFIKRRILVQKLLQIPSGIASRILNGKAGGGQLRSAREAGDDHPVLFP